MTHQGNTYRSTNCFAYNPFSGFTPKRGWRVAIAVAMMLLMGSVEAQRLVAPDSTRMLGDDDTMRYWALYDAQAAAAEQGTSVDYSAYRGRLLRIAIPAGAKSIPLAKENNFCDMMLEVSNLTKDMTLFSRTGKAEKVELRATQVDSGWYADHEALRQGVWLIALRDAHPWVAERKGYGYAVYRQDLVMLQDGVAMNRPVMPYSTDSTLLTANAIRTEEVSLRVENLHIRRCPESTHITRAISVSNLCGVTLRNITIATPQYHAFKSRMREPLEAFNKQWEQRYGHKASHITSATRTRVKLEHDGAIGVSNCFNVRLEDIIVDGTHTVPGSYGYAFSVNNTVEVALNGVKADANWGVFGANNMSATHLKGCHLNRFDVHCYGRDVECHECVFHSKQTQFSSFYGKVIFRQCLFDDCVPVRIRGDYNAHTGFDILMEDCTFRTTLSHHHLVNIILYDTCTNRRPELRERCFPNIEVRGLTVEMPRGVRVLDVYHPTGVKQLCLNGVGYLSHVRLKGVTLKAGARLINPTVRTSSCPIKTKEDFHLEAPYITVKNTITSSGATSPR